MAEQTPLEETAENAQRALIDAGSRHGRASAAVRDNPSPERQTELNAADAAFMTASRGLDAARAALYLVTGSQWTRAEQARLKLATITGRSEGKEAG